MSKSSTYELLLDPICTIFAIDCTLTGELLHVGAMYIEPLIQSQIVHLSSGDATLAVSLPEDLLHRPTPTRAWNVELPIHHG
jgi:hypothetical protein